jgi:hypothetical protein
MGTDFAWFFLRFQTNRVQLRTFCVVKSWLLANNEAQSREEVVSRFKTIFMEYHDISGSNFYEYKYQIWPTFLKKWYTNLKGGQFRQMPRCFFLKCIDYLELLTKFSLLWIAMYSQLNNQFKIEIIHAFVFWEMLIHWKPLATDFLCYY